MKQIILTEEEKEEIEFSKLLDYDPPFTDKSWKKIYYQVNKKEINKKSMIYQKANKKKIKEYQKRYGEINREKMNARSLAYYKMNKGKMREYYKIYYQKNKEKIKANSRKNYMKKI